MSSRVLLVTGHASGGVGLHVQSLAAGLAQQGWPVQVVTSPLTAQTFDFGDAFVPLWPQGSPVARLAMLRRLRTLMAGAEVVHAHGHQAGFVVTALARTLPRRQRPAVIVSWHNWVLAQGRRATVLHQVEARQARWADLVTGASSDLVARALTLGARRAELAPVAGHPHPPVQDRPGCRAALRTELGLPTDAPVALTVSRIAPQKSLEVLVQAAGQVQEADVPLTWIVAGDGEEDLQRRLTEQVNALGVDVRFLGRRSDIGELMNAADLFVLPSQWEARSLALQEAMGAGLPCIATNVGGLPDLLGGSADQAGPESGAEPAVGLLVEAGDADALALAVITVLGSPELAAQLGQAARARFEEFPDETAVVQAWIARYRAAVAPMG